MKRIGIVALIAVLALGALGVGYASWSQTLTIGGSVTTGTFDAQFTNVAKTAVDPPGVTVTLDTSDPHFFGVTIENGYPGFAETVTFDVIDMGTVPGQIDGHGFQILASPEGTTVTVNNPWGVGSYPPWAYYSVSALSSPYPWSGYPPSITITINKKDAAPGMEDAAPGITGVKTTIVKFNVVPLY